MRSTRVWSVPGGIVLTGALVSAGCLVGLGVSLDFTGHRAASSALGLSEVAARAETVHDRSECFGKKPTIVGTDGADDIEGTKSRDVIATLEGDDRVSGLHNQDVVCAGPGDDDIGGVNGYGVALKLGSGADRVSAAREFGWLFAGRGDDTIAVTPRSGIEVLVHLGPGDDRVQPGTPGQLADGFGGVCVSYKRAWHPMRIDLARGIARGQGTDRLGGVHCIYASQQRDQIRGSGGADYIEDRRGTLKVSTRAGDDVVNGSWNNDLVRLGSGDDTYYGSGGDDAAFGGPGDDYLSGDDGVDMLHGGTGNDEVYGAYHCYSNSETLPASDGAPNALYGGPGNDYLIGDIGNDALDGGPGTDKGFGQVDGLLDTLLSLERPTYC